MGGLPAQLWIVHDEMDQTTILRPGDRPGNAVLAQAARLDGRSAHRGCGRGRSDFVARTDRDGRGHTRGARRDRDCRRRDERRRCRVARQTGHRSGQ